MPESRQPMTYGGSGLDYSDLDPFKKSAQRAALETAQNLGLLGCEDLAWSRGESCYLFKHVRTGLILGFVIEGLGTKNLVAEDQELRKALGKTFYYGIAQCNAAMVFNDMVTSGALPIVYALHPALEDGKHLSGQNGADLIAGTRDACHEVGCAWGPGETPGLKGLIVPGTMCLSGSAIGIVSKPEYLINPQNLRPGLRIVLFGSSGVHANGYTLCRRIKTTLPQGYLTPIGRNLPTYGEALLEPTLIYAELINACQIAGIRIFYAINITGHGWRKLMRANQPLTYFIDKIPTPQPIFDFIQGNGPVTIREMYQTFNMGAGFALYVNPADVPQLLEIGEQLNLKPIDAGEIKEGPRQVIIDPIDETYTELDLRG